jgi:hypothetical protein
MAGGVWITAAEAAALLGISRQSLHDQNATLEAEGAAVRSMKGRRMVWRYNSNLLAKVYDGCILWRVDSPRNAYR